MRPWIVLVACALMASPFPVAAQGMAHGRGGMGDGMSGFPSIPERLPRPSAEVLDRLEKVLAEEEFSFAQYGSDANKYQAAMPYQMVLLEENQHVRSLRQLFQAYGVTPSPDVPPVVATRSLDEAIQVGIKNETQLVERYRWLVERAGDETSRQVLATLLRQSQRHLRMFQHAAGGGGMGPGMGPGMRPGR